MFVGARFHCSILMSFSHRLSESIDKDAQMSGYENDGIWMFFWPYCFVRKQRSAGPDLNAAFACFCGGQNVNMGNNQCIAVL